MATVISANGNHGSLHTYQNNHHKQTVAEVLFMVSKHQRQDILKGFPTAI